MSRSIRVDTEVYAALFEAKANIERSERRPASMSDGLRRAINVAAHANVVHEHAGRMDHRFGVPCAKGLQHRGCCPGVCG